MKLIVGIEDFYERYIGGWTQLGNEHFSVFAGPRSGPLVKITAPPWSYFADPFPCLHQGEPWLFVEEFRYSQSQGRLVARRLEGGPLLPLTLSSPGHASFPLLFRIDGELHLLPETGGAGTLDLYACDRFPDRWRLRRRLMSGVDLADTVPLWHDGRWWLISSFRALPSDRGHRRLAIFHTSDLASGTLEPHPMNLEGRFFDSPFSFGRNAGPILQSPQGTLYRPFQASQRYYGESMSWSRIDELSPEAFSETVLTQAPDEVGVLPRRPMHHVATDGDWLACDTRDRFPGT
ncbi:MAG: hypothetical protein ABI672_13340 [Vicinamibacteria bacterium]